MTPSPQMSRDKCKVCYFHDILLKPCFPLLSGTFWPCKILNENEKDVRTIMNDFHYLLAFSRFKFYGSAYKP